jgi:transposase
MYRTNRYWDMVKISNEDNEYPSNMGQKWSDEEEKLLLEELNINADIETIAQKHNRTINGINFRRKYIAQKMYLKNMSTEEIIKQTKLDYESIKQIIEKKQNYNSKKIKPQPPTAQLDNVLITINKNDYIELRNDVKEMKNEIKDLKNSIKELVEMMKAVYEFEDA